MIVAVDPGPVESAYVTIGDDYRPIQFGKVPNDDLRRFLRHHARATTLRRPRRYAIEMIASYGMAVGAEVFATCVWIGRFAETVDVNLADFTQPDAELVFRGSVKVHHCHSSRAKDGNVIQALVDRFAPNTPNKGKGSAKAPGWFHGFAGDVWQAYALAVYVLDRDTAAAR